jgi:DNA-binding response OmpR family regulator
MNPEWFEFGDPGSAPESVQSKDWKSVKISFALLKLLIQQGYVDHLNLNVEPEDESIVGSSEWLSTLTILEQEFYQLLIKSPNQVVTKETIFKQLWPEVDGEFSLIHRLSQLVRHLNQKLPTDYYIKVMLNEGYMLLKFSPDSGFLEKKVIQELSTNEFKLFRLFWQRLDQVVSREDCYQLLWGDNQSESDQYQYLKLSNLVGSLRGKLKEFGAKCEIDTIFNQGYKLIITKI